MQEFFIQMGEFTPFTKFNTVFNANLKCWNNVMPPAILSFLSIIWLYSLRVLKTQSGYEGKESGKKGNHRIKEYSFIISNNFMLANIYFEEIGILYTFSWKSNHFHLACK